MSAALLEVCVDDAAGLTAAVEGGADRIELCSALALGGLTPSAGLMAIAASAGVPAYAMIRPRGGDFVFTDADIAIMQHDIDTARAAGLAGVVLGANSADGRLDTRTLEILTRQAAGLGTTLHRAFDLVPDFEESIDMAVDLGFERILTSGGAKRAVDAVDTLYEIVEAAGARISIMPGSGVSLATAGDIVSRLHIRELHASCSVLRPVPDARIMELGFAGEGAKRTDRETVRALKAYLAGL